MKQAAILLAVISLPACSVDRKYDSVCSALRSVKPDSEGYLPREAVFRAAGISEAQVLTYPISPGRGEANLRNGGWIDFTELNRRSPGRPQTLNPTPRNIDRILNDPDWSKRRPKANQLESVVVQDKKNREVCRVEAPAIRKGGLTRWTMIRASGVLDRRRSPITVGQTSCLTTTKRVIP